MEMESTPPAMATSRDEVRTVTEAFAPPPVSDATSDRRNRMNAEHAGEVDARCYDITHDVHKR